eukprot:gene22570-30836_t
MKATGSVKVLNDTNKFAIINGTPMKTTDFKVHTGFENLVKQLSHIEVLTAMKSLQLFILKIELLLRKGLQKPKAGVRSLTAVLDVLAGLAVAGNLQINAPVVSSRNFFPSSVAVSVVETKQGFYKEYTVDKVDDSALDEVRRSYKTADETEEGKNKYWAILAVLVAGSFIIPMVQYYWYVAEED